MTNHSSADAGHHPEKKPIISFRNIVKRFGPSMVAVDHVSLDIIAGRILRPFSALGMWQDDVAAYARSLEVPTEGQVLIDGQDMGLIPPNKRPSTWCSSPTPCFRT